MSDAEKYCTKMTPTPTTVQRKQGIGVLKPVNWNNGRRFTSPGPGPIHGKQNDISAVTNVFASEVSQN